MLPCSQRTSIQKTESSYVIIYSFLTSTHTFIHSRTQSAHLLTNPQFSHPGPKSNIKPGLLLSSSWLAGSLSSAVFVQRGGGQSDCGDRLTCGGGQSDCVYRLTEALQLHPCQFLLFALRHQVVELGGAVANQSPQVAHKLVDESLALHFADHVSVVVVPVMGRGLKWEWLRFFKTAQEVIIPHLGIHHRYWD